MDGSRSTQFVRTGNGEVVFISCFWTTADPRKQVPPTSGKGDMGLRFWGYTITFYFPRNVGWAYWKRRRILSTDWCPLGKSEAFKSNAKTTEYSLTCLLPAWPPIAKSCEKTVHDSGQYQLGLSLHASGACGSDRGHEQGVLRKLLQTLFRDNLDQGSSCNEQGGQ